MAGWLRQGDLDGKATGGFLWSYLSLEGGTQPMADVRIALRDLLRKYRDDTEVDALKEGLVLLVQELRGGGGEGEDPRPSGTSERRAGERTATGTAEDGGTPGWAR